MTLRRQLNEDSSLFLADISLCWTVPMKERCECPPFRHASSDLGKADSIKGSFTKES